MNPISMRRRGENHEGRHPSEVSEGGETFTTGSTKKELKVEICSKCHPFFTGKQKLVDSGGRVDKFKKRYGDLLNK